jgi:hypothetical protein
VVAFSLLTLVSESDLDFVDGLSLNLNLVLFNMDLVLDLAAHFSLMSNLDFMLMNSNLLFPDGSLVSVDLNLVVVSCLLMTVGASIENFGVVSQISDG